MTWAVNEQILDPPARRAGWSHDWQNRWSHEAGRKPPTAVPCSWQATPSAGMDGCPTPAPVPTRFAPRSPKAGGLGLSLYLLTVTSPAVTTAEGPVPWTVRVAFQTPVKGNWKRPTQMPFRGLSRTGMPPTSRPGLLILRSTCVALRGRPLGPVRSRCSRLPVVVAGMTPSAALPWSARDIWTTAFAAADAPELRPAA